MSITSMLFLFLFLPLALAVYYIANNKVREYVLLALSLLFYSIGSIRYIILFTFLIVITVIIGRTLNSVDEKWKRKVLFMLGIVLNAGALVYYKYSDCILLSGGNTSSADTPIKEIILPLGISFYTFKAISYLTDIYMKKAVLDENPVHDALYLSFFAQIQSGPLTRYNDMVLVDKGGKAFHWDTFSEGVFRFMIGFSKKVLIANVLAKVTTEIFDTPFEMYSLSYAWLGSICYSLQLFFDFSGYSDMAIGISGMFGYKCMENFNYPYMTESVTKFWRRWHISLSEWFRDYIYIPLGGSRNKLKWRVYLNLFVVWLLTGIWHGAAWNFVIWGLGYFVAISFERITDFPNRLKTRLGRIIYRVLTLLFINFQWVLFNSKSLSHGLRYIKRMFICPANPLADQRAAFLVKDYFFFIICAIVLCFPVVSWIDKKVEGKKLAHRLFEAVIAFAVIFAFVWAVSFIVAGQNNPFAYANF